MRLKAKYKIITVLLVIIAIHMQYCHIYAQIGGSSFGEQDIYNKGKIKNKMGLDPNAMQMESDTLKSDKKAKERKPLMSFLFSDSLKVKKVFAWTHNPYSNSIDTIAIDTALRDFHKDYLFFNQRKEGVIYNGFLGGPAMPLSYIDRSNLHNFAFLNSYAMYLYTPEKVKFYNGKKPFTQLSFFTSGQLQRAEEQLRVIHQQNISPSTSFSLDYRNNGTKGMYNSQRSKVKDLSFAIAHTGKKYTIHTGYIYNMGDITENGGVTEDKLVTDTLIDLPYNIPTNLKDAKNRFYGHTFFLTQSYAIPFRRLGDDDGTIADKSALFVGNSIEYTNYQRSYQDKRENVLDGFYPNWYLNKDFSSDSLRESMLDIKAFIQLQPYNRNGLLGLLGGGAGYTMSHYYYFTPNDYIFERPKNKHNTVYVYADGQGSFRKYLKWNAHYKVYPLGYRSGDMSVSGKLELSAYVRQKPIRFIFDAQYSMQTPSFWSEHYFSNHYMWNNSFNKENETRLGAKIVIPNYGIEAGITQSIYKNRIYFGNNSLPAQHTGTLDITGVYLQKDFRIGGFNFENRVLLQRSSSQEVAPVPLVSANATYYYEFNVVKDVLRVQIGINGYYNSSFYGPAYNPALMQYYNQNIVKTGDYMWADAFISGKWKRVRFLIKLQHLNYELFGGRNYFLVAHYPLNRRMLKLGVSWNFYD